MKIATWNVNSIRARMERLCAWLAAQSPDVVCLQETKVEDHALPMLELAALGYHVSAQADMGAMLLPGLKRPDARILAFTAGDYIEGFRTLRALISLAPAR